MGGSGEQQDSLGPPTEPGQSRRDLGRHTLGFVLSLTALTTVVGVTVWLLLPGQESIPAAPEVDLSNAPQEVAAAIASAQAQVAASPQAADAWGQLAILLRAHDFAAAANLCFAQAERLDPQDVRWPYLHGVSLAVTDAEAALTCYQRAVTAQPDFVHARLRYGEQLLSLGRLQEADAQFRAALEFDSHNARAQLGLARVAWLEGDVQQSLRWARQSLEAAPDKRTTHELLLRICHQLGDQQAVQRHTAMLERLPAGQTLWDDPLVAMVIEMRRDPEWMALQAQRMAQTGQLGSAIGIFEYLVEQHPENAAFHGEFARILLLANLPDRALEVLVQALARYPHSAEMQRLRGDTHFSRQQWSQAAECFRGAIQAKPDDADAYHRLGETLVKLDDRPGAQEAFAQALRLKPSLAAAHVGLGRLLLEAGQSGEARECFQRAARLVPGDPQIRKLLEAADSAPDE